MGEGDLGRVAEPRPGRGRRRSSYALCGLTAREGAPQVPIGLFFAGFLVELHIILVFVLGMLGYLASSVHGRGACCTQGVWDLHGFSLKFNKSSPTFPPGTSFAMVLYIFLHEGNRIVKSGTCWSGGQRRKCQAANASPLLSQRAVDLAAAHGALLQHRHSDPAGHIWEMRLLNKCTDNLQIPSIVAAK